MTTRAKFRCTSVNDFGGGSKAVRLDVAYDPNGNGENANFTKATPSGMCEMRIDNPEAALQFVPGQYYYADFTLA